MEWTSKAPMPTARAYLAAGVISDVLYVVGGASGTNLSTNQAYTPSSDTWSTKASMPTARGFLAAGVINGKLYAVGGYSGSNLATNEEYRPPYIDGLDTLLNWLAAA